MKTAQHVAAPVPAPVPLLDSLRADPDYARRVQAGRSALLVGLGGIGAGVAAAGIKGLVGLGSRPGPKTVVPHRLVPVPIPGDDPLDDEEEDPLVPPRQVAKWAQAPPPTPTPPPTPPPTPVDPLAARAGEPLTRLSAHLMNAFGGGPEAQNPTRSPAAVAAFNPGAASADQMPFHLPAMLGLGAGGVYAGHKLTEYLRGASSDAEQDSELETARARYERALLGRHKEAEDPSVRSTLLGGLSTPLGIAALGMGGLGLGAGYMSYNATRAAAPDKATEEALKERRRRIHLSAPASMQAVPTYVPTPPPPSASLFERVKALGDGGLLERMRARYDNDDDGPPKEASLVADVRGVEDRLKQRSNAYYADIAAMRADADKKPAAKPVEAPAYRPPSAVVPPTPPAAPAAPAAPAPIA